MCGNSSHREQVLYIVHIMNIFCTSILNFVDISSQMNFKKLFNVMQSQYTRFFYKHCMIIFDDYP